MLRIPPRQPEPGHKSRVYVFPQIGPKRNFLLKGSSFHPNRLGYLHIGTRISSRAINNEGRTVLGDYEGTECVRDPQVSQEERKECFFHLPEKKVHIQKLFPNVSDAFREEVLAHMVPREFVDGKHVYGWKEVLSINKEAPSKQGDNGIYMIGDKFQEFEPGHVRVDQNGRVVYSGQHHTLTDFEAMVLLNQLLEGLFHIYRIDRYGKIIIKNVVISNNRLQFILGATDRMDKHVLFAATGVRTNRFKEQRYLLPEEYDKKEHNRWAKHLNMCLVFLLELYTESRICERIPNGVDSRYNLLVSSFRILSTRPISGWEEAVRRSPLAADGGDLIQVVNRIRQMHPVLLQIFEGVVCYQENSRWTIPYTHWYLSCYLYHGRTIVLRRNWEGAAMVPAHQSCVVSQAHPASGRQAIQSYPYAAATGMQVPSPQSRPRPHPQLPQQEVESTRSPSTDFVAGQEDVNGDDNTDLAGPVPPVDDIFDVLCYEIDDPDSGEKEDEKVKNMLKNFSFNSLSTMGSNNDSDIALNQGHGEGGNILDDEDTQGGSGIDVIDRILRDDDSGGVLDPMYPYPEQAEQANFLATERNGLPPIIDRRNDISTTIPAAIGNLDVTEDFNFEDILSQDAFL